MLKRSIAVDVIVTRNGRKQRMVLAWHQMSELAYVGLKLACIGLSWLELACVGLRWVVLDCVGLSWLALDGVGLRWLALA